jgi:beta-galactosidase
MKARVGVSRALINANVPWEYVTASDLCAGLASRYRAIYLPVLYAIPPDLLRLLHRYVRQGGRVVLDMPGAWQDDMGRQLNTDCGTLFEKTFGCMIRDFQYSSNVPRHLHDRRLTGCVADLAPTRAQVVEEFDNGLPAITEASGAVILGYEASLLCYRPGNADAESWLVKHTLGSYRSPYACNEAIVYRLAAPQADHYFLINDGPAVQATLTTRPYRRVTDAVTGEELRGPVPVPAYSGRWLRAEK